MLEYVRLEFAERVQRADDVFSIPLPPLLAEQPEMTDQEQLIWQAYAALRLEGMTPMGEGFIPRSAIRAYLREELNMSDPDELEEWIDSIRTLESEYFLIKERKRELAEKFKKMNEQLPPSR